MLTGYNTVTLSSCSYSVSCVQYMAKCHSPLSSSCTIVVILYINFEILQHSQDSCVMGVSIRQIPVVVGVYLLLRFKLLGYIAWLAIYKYALRLQLIN